MCVFACDAAGVHVCIRFHMDCFGQYVWVCNLYTCMYDIVYLYFSRHEVGGGSSMSDMQAFARTCTYAYWRLYACMHG